MSSRAPNQPPGERGLFAEICSILAVLGALVAALLAAEAVSRVAGPVGWLGYLPLWVVTSIAILGIAAIWHRDAYRRFINLAEARLPTPILLQRGYRRIEETFESKRKDPSLLWKALGYSSYGVLLVVMFAVLDGIGMDSAYLAAVGPFLVILIFLCLAHAVWIALLLLASLVAGLLLG